MSLGDRGECRGWGIGMPWYGNMKLIRIKAQGFMTAGVRLPWRERGRKVV